jgi:hypothetical protein
MKYLAILAVIAGTSLQAQPQWQPLFMDNHGTRYELDVSTKHVINTKGEVNFIVRGLFVQPTVVQLSEKEQYVSIGFLMALKGSCISNQAQIIRDAHVTLDGKLFAENAMAAEDKMSDVDPQSPAGAALRIVWCFRAYLINLHTSSTAGSRDATIDIK